MPISFKSERKKALKTMYGDIVDAYVDEVIKNQSLSKDDIQEKREEAAEWKIEFKEMLKDL